MAHPLIAMEAGPSSGDAGGSAHSTSPPSAADVTGVPLVHYGWKGARGRARTLSAGDEPGGGADIDPGLLRGQHPSPSWMCPPNGSLSRCSLSSLTGVSFLRECAPAQACGPHASADVYGHAGSQSSLCFVDPKHGLAAVIYLNARPGALQNNARLRRLSAAIYEDLGIASCGEPGGGLDTTPGTAERGTPFESISDARSQSSSGSSSPCMI